MKILFVLPENVIGGGILAVYHHARHLTSVGHEVLILYHSYQKGRDKHIIDQFNLKWGQLDEFDFSHRYDIVIATWWETLFEVTRFKAEHYFYFIQSDERRFYEDKSSDKILYCNFTYNLPNIGIITVASWLKKELLSVNSDLSVEVCPVGFDPSVFHPSKKPQKDRKFRVLIEGPGQTWFRRVGYCFRAVENIENIEIWFVSRDGYVDPSWRIDQYFENISPVELAEVYRSCDVLLKMSEVESFCLPNLEMMACGGTIITTNFTGQEEYAVNGINSIVIPMGDIKSAKNAILKLRDNQEFLQNLQTEAYKTASSMTWGNQSKKFELALNSLKEKFEHSDYATTIKQIEIVGTIKTRHEILLKGKEKLQIDYNYLFHQHHRLEYSAFRFLGRIIYRIPVLGSLIRYIFKKLSKK